MLDSCHRITMLPYPDRTKAGRQASKKGECMPHNNFEAIEAALQHLKDIVSKNHPAETTFLVSQMEKIVAELKSKTISRSDSLDKAVFQTTPANITATTL